MARSYTVWERLDPLSRNPDLTRTLRMELADPAWLLARQRQFGEFMGEDAGSPVEISITVRQDAVSRVKLGSAESDPYDPTKSPPLETLIEREPVAAQAEDGPKSHLRAEAGMHFLRRLHDALLEPPIGLDPGDLPGPADFDKSYWIAPPEISDAEGRRYVGVLDDGRALDGHALYRAFRQAGSDANRPVPDGFDDWSEAARDAYHGQVVEGFIAWYEKLVQEPAAVQDTWDSERMEYRAQVSAGVGDGEVVFEASEYEGGRLDWYAFDADPDRSLGAEGDAASPHTVRRLPTRADFRGMPTPRLWEMEDAALNLSAIRAAGDDLSRLFLLEFLLISGNNWFALPLEAPVGTVTRIDDVTVTDTFQARTQGTATESRQSVWRMYTFDTPEPGLLLPPVLGSILHSEPVERVVFGRDEMANLLFAVEEIFEGPLGEPIDRDVFALPTLTISAIHPADDAIDEYVTLHNRGDDELALHGWKILVDGNDELHSFNKLTLPARGNLEVVTGGQSALDTSTRLHAGNSAPMLTQESTLEIRNAQNKLVLKEPVRQKALEGLDRYRLVNEVPNHWFPYVLRQRNNDHRFLPALLLDADALTGSVNALPRPLGRVLSRGASLYEEEVTRSGLSVTRRYQMTGWVDGSTYLWSGRRVQPGRGEISSGLRFDVLERVKRSA